MFLFGCSGLTPRADTPECRAVNSRFVAYGYAARGGAIASLGSTIAATQTTDEAETTFRITAGAAAVLAAGAALLQANAARDYVDRCTR